jgi:hypothetical protein
VFGSAEKYDMKCGDRNWKVLFMFPLSDSASDSLTRTRTRTEYRYKSCLH